MDEDLKNNNKPKNSNQSDISNSPDDRPIVWLRDDDDRKYRELSWKLRKGESQYLLFEGSGSIFERKLNPNASQFKISNQQQNRVVTKNPEKPIDISNDVPAKNADGQMNVDVNPSHQQPLDDLAEPQSSIDRILGENFDPSEDVDAEARESGNQIPETLDEATAQQRIVDNLNQGQQSQWQPETPSLPSKDDNKSDKPLNQGFKNEPTPVDLKRRGQIEALNKKLQNFLKKQQD